MGRRSPHPLNKNTEFQDRYGRLKDGFSFEGGAGMVARGTIETNVRSGAGKDGTSYKKGSRTVYSREAQPAPAPVRPPAPAPAPPPPPRPQPKPPTPVVHSPEIQQAKERVNKYQADIKSGKVSEEIYGKSRGMKSGNVSEDAFGQDYSKDTYIAESSLNKNQLFDFSQNSFLN